MVAKTDRREFMKTRIGHNSSSVRLWTRLYFRSRQISRPGKNSKCSGRCDISWPKPRAMTRAAVDTLGGMKRFVKPGAKVVIKPNMSFARTQVGPLLTRRW